MSTDTPLWLWVLLTTTAVGTGLALAFLLRRLTARRCDRGGVRKQARSTRWVAERPDKAHTQVVFRVDVMCPCDRVAWGDKIEHLCETRGLLLVTRPQS